MDTTKIKSWLEDDQMIETHEISPGYQAIIRYEQEQELFTVYVFSSKRAQFLAAEYTIEDARDVVTRYTTTYLAWLAKRRLKAPTPAQLGMLFRWKIPITIDLTFGQAWDIIDIKKKEECLRKQKLNINKKG